MLKNDIVMNYVIIDTNVIVSALLTIDRRESITLTIIKAVFTGNITPVLSSDIMEEYREVLSRKKFGFDQKLIESFLLELKAQSVFINPPKTHLTIPDPKDVCFLEAAMVYENVGGWLVTGNKKHYPNCPFTITPAQLKEKLLTSPDNEPRNTL